MKIKRVRNRYLYNIGLITISTGFVYIFTFHGKELKSQDILELFFLGSTGFLMCARAFYVDRYFRLLSNDDAVDFWLFFNDTNFIKILWYYFSLFPFNSKKANLDCEKTRKLINKLTISSYFFIITTIIILYFQRK
jgi:hypothetical protein